MPGKKVGGGKRAAEKSDAKSSEEKRAKKEEEPEVAEVSEEGAKPMRSWKIISWNVNGIRAWMKKEGLKIVREEAPDILTLQETKCQNADLPPELGKLKDYHCYWVGSEKKGYAGVGLLTKTKPLSVNFGLGSPQHDNEGRLITAEYEDFYLVAAYVPNSGQGLKRLDYRLKSWNPDLLAHLKALDAKKPLIYTGDLNVSHKEIDLKNPKANVKNAGFTPEEREGMDELLAAGFIDSYRHLYPDKEGAYTYWSFMANSRAKGIGWRLDYFLLSQRLLPSLRDNVILDQYYGSDHCPIALTLGEAQKQ